MLTIVIVAHECNNYYYCLICLCGSYEINSKKIFGVKIKNVVNCHSLTEPQFPIFKIQIPITPTQQSQPPALICVYLVYIRVILWLQISLFLFGLQTKVTSLKMDEYYCKTLLMLCLTTFVVDIFGLLFMAVKNCYHLGIHSCPFIHSFLHSF